MGMHKIKYFIKQTIESISKNKIMTGASVITVSACIFIFLICLCITINVKEALNRAEQNVRIEVFLGDALSNDEVETLKTRIENIPNVKAVKYSNAEQALEEAAQIWDANLIESFRGDNPFPRSLEITADGIGNQEKIVSELEKIQKELENKLISSGVLIQPITESSTLFTTETTTVTTTSTTTTETTTETTTDEFDYYFDILDFELSDDALSVETTTVTTTIMVKQVLTPVVTDTTTETTTEHIPIPGEVDYVYRGIEYIGHSSALTNALNIVNTVLSLTSIALLVILFIISAGIITNTVKITVYTRRNEITIMKYVGATDSFIKIPFIGEGMIIGFLGSSISAISVYFCYDYVLNYIKNKFVTLPTFFTLISTNELMLKLFPIAILLGVFIGAVGSASSIRKYLKV